RSSGLPICAGPPRGGRGWPARYLGLLVPVVGTWLFDGHAAPLLLSLARRRQDSEIIASSTASTALP
ncbi:MAG: hypothetical protein WCD65_22515, partial [Pseudolabrys sp.]